MPFKIGVRAIYAREGTKADNYCYCLVFCLADDLSLCSSHSAKKTFWLTEKLCDEK